MIISNLNLNNLRVFMAVYRHKSMTKAAEELFMTQSGVSQHIKILEDTLELTLFDRIKQRLVPTRQAKDLFYTCNTSLNSIEKTLSKITNKSTELTGVIKIGVPIEFGNNLVLPRLADFGKKNPQVSFKITYGFASEMNQKLLTGEIDFAFVDDYALDKKITTQVIFRETFSLCASESYIKQFDTDKFDKSFFESLSYISYIDKHNIISQWFKHHYGFKSLNLKIRATLLDVQGVGQLIGHDFGVGILPMHKISGKLKMGFKIFRFSDKKRPMTNNISIAYLEERSHGPAVELLITEFGDSLKEFEYK